MEDLKKFYEIGELDAGDEKPAPLHAVSAAKKQPGHVKRKEQLEQQLIKVKEDSEKLTDLMARAKVKDGEPEDSPGRLEALNELVQRFFTSARKVKVKLQEALTDKDGKELAKFAMKELDPEKAEAQLAKLDEHLKIVQQFFPHVELKEIASADDPPKRIAIVFGIDAEEFNAVVMAEKTRKLYEHETREVEQGIKNAQAAIEQERIDRKLAAATTKAAKIQNRKENSPPMVVH